MDDMGQEIVRIKLAIAIANAKGSAVDFSDACTARGGFLQFLRSLHWFGDPFGWKN